MPISPELEKLAELNTYEVYTDKHGHIGNVLAGNEEEALDLALNLPQIRTLENVNIWLLG